MTKRRPETIIRALNIKHDCPRCAERLATITAMHTSWATVVRERDYAMGQVARLDRQIKEVSASALATLETERKAMGARIEQLEGQQQRLVRGLTVSIYSDIHTTRRIIKALVADAEKEETKP